MKTIFRIPIAQYAYMELHGTDKDIKKMEKLYNDYAETPIKFQNGIFKKIHTFTDEDILYNEEAHKYTDLEGNHLVSGSEYAKKFEKKFDKAAILPQMEKKYGIKSQVIDDMWTSNGQISRDFGTLVHKLLENWFRYKDTGTEREYHLPKNPFLRSIIEKFPMKDGDIEPEVMVSCIENKVVGVIDGLEFPMGHMKTIKTVNIIDYKTDVDIQKNLKKHFQQASFYAHILTLKGWVIPKVVIWNYVDKWELFESEPLEIKL